MPKVFIDIGHGGSDSGAINSVVYEKNINLIVGLKLKALLEQQGFDVACSRYNDSFIDLTPRCNLANQWKADIFVSVHHNAGGGDGYEVIHSIHYGVGTTLSELIAAEFAALGQNAHGVGVYSKQGNHGDYYAVIRQTNMPAVICEYAFLDSKDFNAIDTDEELIQEAQAICKAICKYYGVENEVKRMEEKEMHWAQPLFDKAKEKGLITSDHDLDKPLTLGEILAIFDRLGMLD